MAQSYLIRRNNGRWYARYQKHGKWTHRSLGTEHKAFAQVRFAKFLKELEDGRLLFSAIRPLKLADFAQEYLGYVKSHKSHSWYVKQKNYFNRLILPFFGPNLLTTQVTSRMIEQYVETRSQSVKKTAANKEPRMHPSHDEEGGRMGTRSNQSGKES